MLRDKIRQLEGRPGGSPKIKELLRKLKVAVDGPQSRQSTSAVYRVVHLVVHCLLLTPYYSRDRLVQSGASDRSLDFDDEYLGSSPGCWVATVATYCLSVLSCRTI